MTDFYRYKIKPIFVFDGKAIEEKKDEKEKRNKRKLDQIKTIEDIKIKLDDKHIKLNIDTKIYDEFILKKTYPNIDENEIKELCRIKKEYDQKRKNYINITPKKIEQVKKLLQLMGAQIIDLKTGDGEGVCSILNRLGIVDYVVCEDGDVFPFGAISLIRGIGSQQNREQNMKYYNIKAIVKEFELPEDEFIDFCILCGCDYSEKITGIGPVNAYKLIKQYHNIENIIKFITETSDKKIKKYIIPLPFNYEKARNVFKKHLKYIELDQELKNNFLPIFPYNHEQIVLFLCNIIPEADDYVRLWTYFQSGILPNCNHNLMEQYR